MKAFIDRNRCIGCGICAAVSPAVFAVDDEGKAVAMVTDVPEGSREKAVKATKACPASVIMLEY